MVLLAAYNSLT